MARQSHPLFALIRSLHRRPDDRDRHDDREKKNVADAVDRADLGFSQDVAAWGWVNE